MIPSNVLFHGPTGLVTFKDNGTTLATSLITTSASDVTSATFNTSTLAVGSHSITASYAGSGDFNASSATATITQAINTASTGSAVSTNATPSISGQPVILTAVVTDTSTLVSGLTASYYNLSVFPYSVNVAFNLPTGTPNIYANLVTTRTDTQINVPDNGNGFVPTNPVSELNTTDVAASWTGLIQITTAGTYTFFSRSDDGSLLYIDGTLVDSNDGLHYLLDGASAPITLSAGYHTIEELAFQGGGPAGVEVDYQGPDTGNSRVIIPASVLFHSGGTPTGAVNFLVNGVAVGNGTLNTVNGLTTATFTTSTLPTGNDAITASYNTNGNLNASTSSAFTQVVVNQTVSATAVAATPNPSVYGQSVTITAAVASTAAPGLTASYYNLSVAPSSVTTAFNEPSGTPTANATLVTSRIDAQINVPNNYNGFVPTVPVSGLDTSNVAVEWSGFIQITQAGTYTFYSPSDDGSILYVDGQQVVYTDYLRGLGDGTSTPITLSAGDHTFRELYIQGGSYAGVVVSYQGPDTGGIRGLIPASVFFHPTASPTGTVTFSSNGTTIGSATRSPPMV